MPTNSACTKVGSPASFRFLTCSYNSRTLQSTHRSTRNFMGFLSYSLAHATKMTGSRYSPISYPSLAAGARRPPLPRARAHCHHLRATAHESLCQARHLAELRAARQPLSPILGITFGVSANDYDMRRHILRIHRVHASLRFMVSDMHAWHTFSQAPAARSS